jgi:hypothetical protein
MRPAICASAWLGKREFAVPAFLKMGTMTARDFGGEAAQRIWGLVCAFPVEQREVRRLLMLQAYMDESEQGHYFVLAGYVSSVPNWAAFSDEWRALLNHGSPHYPRLEEFKMSEMMSSDGRMEMVLWFYRVIEKYVEFGLEVVIPTTFVRQEFAKVNWPDWMDRPERHKNPYWIAFNGLFHSLRMHRARLGITEKVDFIFDKRIHDDDLCREAWAEMAKDDPGFRELCGEDPQFRDSKLNLPLQAADFIAYWAREWKENGERPTTGNLPFPWWEAGRDIPTMALYLDAQSVRSDWEYAIKLAEAERSGKKLPPKYRIHWADEV